MENIGGTILSGAISVVVTLVVTLLFNKLVSLPKSIKQEKLRQQQELANIRAQQQEELAAIRVAYQEEIQKLRTELEAFSKRLESSEAIINNLHEYRAQSLKIQEQLNAADAKALAALENLLVSMRRLEAREKNSLRAKILREYRLFTNPLKNPKLAWSEMEHHAFFELVSDYEDLGGNDFVHSTVLPAMNGLEVILMTDGEALAELMASRKF